MSSPYFGGNFPGSQVFAVDGDHTVAQPIGAPRISFPFEGDSHAPTKLTARLVLANNSIWSGYRYDLYEPTLYQSNFNRQSFILEQDFQVAADFFSPLFLNTVYDVIDYAPNYVGNLFLGIAVLVAESPTQDIGNGMVRWTRTYATVPAPRSSYSTNTFTFPAIQPVQFYEFNSPVDDVEIGLNAGPYTTEILCRSEFEYFILSNDGVFPQPFSPEYLDRSSPWFIEPKFSVFFGTLANQTGHVSGSAYKDLITTQGANGKDLDANGNPFKIPLNSIPPLYTEPPLTLLPNDPDSGIGYFDMLHAAVEICVQGTQIRHWRGNIYEKITLWSQAR